MKVTTKVISYDAVKIPAAGAEFDAAAPDLTWILDAALAGVLHRTDAGITLSHADQGTQTGEPGDYLMRAADGGMAICPAGAFAEHYDVPAGTSTAGATT